MTIGLVVKDKYGKWIFGCDSMCCDGKVRGNTIKYYKGKNIRGVFAGDVGLIDFSINYIKELDENERHINNYYAFLRQLRNTGEKEGFDWREDGIEMLLEVNGKILYIYDGRLNSVLDEEEWYAIGSGREVALGILKYDDNRIECMKDKHVEYLIKNILEVCSEIYIHCGGKPIVF